MGLFFPSFCGLTLLPRVCLDSILHAENGGRGLVSRMFRQDFRILEHVRHIPIFIGSRVIKEGTWKCGEERELKHSKKRTCKAA
jgi:hypothetical protein